jgi:hypothetical protein
VATPLTSNQMATPKLYYYAGKRGEAEAIRMLFKELGQVHSFAICVRVGGGLERGGKGGLGKRSGGETGGRRVALAARSKLCEIINANEWDLWCGAMLCAVGWPMRSVCVFCVLDGGKHTWLHPVLTTSLGPCLFSSIWFMHANTRGLRGDVPIWVFSAPAALSHQVSRPLCVFFFNHVSLICALTPGTAVRGCAGEA